MFPLKSEAQSLRQFPLGVLRGSIVFTAPPQVLLDGRAERLGPGVRVRDTHNLVVLSGALKGKEFIVNYLRDPAGVVREIWLLTPAEAARQPSGSSARRQANTERPASLYAN